MAPNKPRELLLRAELHHGARRIIAHTVTLSQSYTFVQTEYQAGIGDRIRTRLSFPGLLAPFAVDTQVIASKLSLGPGDLGGLTLGFLFYSEPERLQVEDLARPIQPRTKTPRARPTGRAYRVLIVEDSPFVRDAFAFGVDRLGETSGLAVELVNDSDEALERLFENRYDLAIVDYFLPTANGDRLISRLRGNPSLQELPVFAFSGVGEDVRQASLDAGADLFLHKPIIMRSLFPTLVQLSLIRPPGLLEGTTEAT